MLEKKVRTRKQILELAYMIFFVSFGLLYVIIDHLFC